MPEQNDDERTPHTAGGETIDEMMAHLEAAEDLDVLSLRSALHPLAELVQLARRSAHQRIEGHRGSHEALPGVGCAPVATWDPAGEEPSE